MELESYLNVALRQSLGELLSARSPIWPEVKVFLSICKAAEQRLPPEVQVWNMMNVRKGLRRLLRLGSSCYTVHVHRQGGVGPASVRDQDPRQVVALLRWIVERTEVAAAYGLQRLRIGHQVNWICALLASVARIRQFCVEFLDKVENSSKSKAGPSRHIDEGVPLDRSAFARLRKVQPSDACCRPSSSAGPSPPPPPPMRPRSAPALFVSSALSCTSSIGSPPSSSSAAAANRATTMTTQNPASFRSNRDGPRSGQAVPATDLKAPINSRSSSSSGGSRSIDGINRRAGDNNNNINNKANNGDHDNIKSRDYSSAGQRGDKSPGAGVLGDDVRSELATDDAPTSSGKQPRHPQIRELHDRIKHLMKGQSAKTKTALKKVYATALKRSLLYEAADNRPIDKLCKSALKKAQSLICAK